MEAKSAPPDFRRRVFHIPQKNRPNGADLWYNIRTMVREIVCLGVAMLLAGASSAYEWTNLTAEARLGGRMVSAGYLRGKIVVMDRRDYTDSANAADIEALQKMWASYKTKSFVVVGSHTGSGDAKGVEKALARLGVTYPVYANAGVLRDGEMVDSPELSVFDSTGTRRIYGGQDVHKVAGVVGSAIFSTRMPTTAKQWRYLLDWEMENLPGQAFIRLKDLDVQDKVIAEMKAKYPDSLHKYAQTLKKWREDNEIKKLAKLVELSRLVKDRDPHAKTKEKITKSVIEKAIEKYESLKQSKNPNVVQEAKNAIADLQFSAASLDE